MYIIYMHLLLCSTEGASNWRDMRATVAKPGERTYYPHYIKESLTPLAGKDRPLSRVTAVLPIARPVLTRHKRCFFLNIVQEGGVSRVNKRLISIITR